MKRRILVISIAAIVAGGATFGLAGRHSSASPKAGPAPSITVNLVSPQSSSFARAIAATGTVSPRDELVIGSDASGVRLLEVLVDVGATVQKGQLLARADDSQLQTQLAQQVAAVKQAQADYTQAKANKDRAEQLDGYFSIETIQTRRTSEATAAAKLELAVAQREELKIKIAHTRIVAPASGTISKKAATVGAVVQQGTELFHLIKESELEWRAELPSHSLARVRQGERARIALDNGDYVEGTVRMVAPTIDTATRNGLVYVALPKNAALKAGAHARGEILMGASQALALPESSVLARDGYPFVFVVGPDAIAHQVKIETGARQGGLVEVSSGLQPDARVVATGAGFVKDGDLVRVAPAVAAIPGGKS
jgi:RND family efflux transporter MFP subunit